LNYNQIAKIENLDELHKLTWLFLESNQITKFENLDKLPNLDELHLNDNQITEIENLDNLSNLTELYMQANQISSIDSSIILLQNLQLLDITGNLLDQSMIDNFPRLLPNCKVYSF